MKQAIRALGWAIYVLWFVVIVFTASAVYSAFQLRPEFGDPNMSTLDDTLILHLPLNITNGGFYDISNFHIATSVTDSNGTLIANSSSPPQLIPSRSNVSVTHNISISISQMIGNLSYLLQNDSVFNVNATLSLNYANVIPFEISTNLTLPWGAPLSNLTWGQYSLTPSGVALPVSFENHSPIDLDGFMRLEIFDNNNNAVGEGTTIINASPYSGYGTTVNVHVSGIPANIREAHLSFETSAFNYGPLVIPLA